MRAFSSLLALVAAVSCCLLYCSTVSAAPQMVQADFVQDIDEGAFLESTAQVQLTSGIESLTPEEFRALLTARNPLLVMADRDAALLETSADADAEADSEVEADVATEIDSAADVDVDAADTDSLAAAHDSHPAWMELETELPWIPRAAGSAGGAASSAGGAASSAGGAASSAGGAASSAGGSASSAGGSASSAGGSASSAGGSASSAGGSASSAGGSASSAGGSASSAGGAASRSGGNNKPIVQPLLTSPTKLPPAKFPPGQGYVDKRDWVCWVFYKLYSRRYGMWSKTVSIADAQKLGKEFDARPSKFCDYKTGPDQGTWKNAQTVFNKVWVQSGHPFVNKIVAADIRDSSIRAQLQCGSCWAEATIGNFEVALKKANLFVKPLAIQQILDCVKAPKYPNSNGCAGGLPMDALTYMQTHGLAYEAQYPATRKDGGKCRESLGLKNHKSFGWDLAHFPASIVQQTKSDYKPCTTPNCADQWKYELDFVFAVENEGPYIVWVDASQWQKYGGGVFDSNYCQSTQEAGNHIVELLGYGQQEGIPYWLVKNSWGKTWGENGYIKLPMGNNACGLFNYVGRASPTRLVSNAAAAAQLNKNPTKATASSAAKAVAKPKTAAKPAAKPAAPKTAAKPAAKK